MRHQRLHTGANHAANGTLGGVEVLPRFIQQLLRGLACQLDLAQLGLQALDFIALAQQGLAFVGQQITGGLVLGLQLLFFFGVAHHQLLQQVQHLIAALGLFDRAAHQLLIGGGQGFDGVVVALAQAQALGLLKGFLAD